MLPCASTAEEVSLEWSHHRISLIDAQKLVFPYKTIILVRGMCSETPPYGHLGYTVTSLRPLFLAAWQNRHTFPCKKTVVDTVTR